MGKQAHTQKQVLELLRRGRLKTNLVAHHFDEDVSGTILLTWVLERYGGDVLTGLVKLG
jgi:hypothetical protein